jgi:hypothetical protein
MISTDFKISQKSKAHLHKKVQIHACIFFSKFDKVASVIKVHTLLSQLIGRIHLSIGILEGINEPEDEDPLITRVPKTDHNDKLISRPVQYASSFYHLSELVLRFAKFFLQFPSWAFLSSMKLAQ